MSQFKTLDDLPADLSGQTALVRVDLNLPMQEGRDIRYNDAVNAMVCPQDLWVVKWK